MNKEKRLDKTQKAVQHCVDRAEIAWQLSLKQCHEKQESISSLQDYEQHYQQSLLQRGKAGIKAWQFQQVEGFISHLHIALETEKSNLHQLEELANDKKQALCQQQIKKIAIENLSDKYHLAYQHQCDLDEQVEQDDLAVLQKKTGK